MSVFNFYIMVDWSGAARRRGMRTDSIWIAFGNIEDETPETVSPFSRSEAADLVRELLRTQLSEKRRTLVCFDFAYGFPRDFAAALQAATGTADHALPWLAVWEFLRNEIIDDEGTTSFQKPTNLSNRFDETATASVRHPTSRHRPSRAERGRKIWSRARPSSSSAQF